VKLLCLFLTRIESNLGADFTKSSCLVNEEDKFSIDEFDLKSSNLNLKTFCNDL
jgi:hypothetical protein